MSDQNPTPERGTSKQFENDADCERIFEAKNVLDITRRSLMGGIAALGIGSIATGTGVAKSVNISTTDIEGPIGGGTPQTASVPDLSEYGYAEYEFFITGEASPLGPANPYPVEEREDPPEEAADYTTRILVYRPIESEDFNGGVIAGWPNVSTGRDVPVTWINTYEHIMSEGYAYVIISAQKVGVDSSPIDQDLKASDPDRYSDLNHPGDSYSFDIYAQAIESLRTQRNSELLGGFETERVLATGMSQSAQYLRYYINEIQEDHQLIDGFLPFITSQTPQEESDLRDDVAPVLWTISEDESDLERRPDSGLFKLWEVAGASHINYWLSSYAEVMVTRDQEGVLLDWDEKEAGQYGERDDGRYGICSDSESLNYFPVRYAYSAALSQLDEWVTEQEEPPTAPRFEREDGEVQRDQYGNILGGVQLPPIEVPVAFYDAVPCGLYGRTYQLGETVIEEVYSDHDGYVDQMQAAADEAVDSGYLLPADSEALLDRVENSPVLE